MVLKTEPDRPVRLLVGHDSGPVRSMGQKMVKLELDQLSRWFDRRTGWTVRFNFLFFIFPHPTCKATPLEKLFFSVETLPVTPLEPSLSPRRKSLASRTPATLAKPAHDPVGTPPPPVCSRRKSSSCSQEPPALENTLLPCIGTPCTRKAEKLSPFCPSETSHPTLEVSVGSPLPCAGSGNPSPKTPLPAPLLSSSRFFLKLFFTLSHYYLFPFIFIILWYLKLMLFKLMKILQF